MKALKQNPDSGIAPLMRANPGLDRRLQEASVKATMPVFFPADTSKPFGYMDPAEWEAFAGWMRDNGLIGNLPIAPELLSNAYLLGEIPE